jgi:serine/threonine protein phosphatase PrpC
MAVARGWEGRPLIADNGRDGVLMSRNLAAKTNTGLVRGRNEDSAYVGHWLCAVADGLGGHVAGDIASTAVVKALRPFDLNVSPGQLTSVLGRAVSAASDQLAAMIAADRGLIGMGSTLTAMLWADNCTAVANIGDSRGYLVRRGALSRITEDHVLGKLVANPAPARIGAALVRYLDGRLDRSPDLTVRTMLPGDRFMICSDGLSGVLEPQIVRDVLTSVADAGQTAAELIRLTLEAGAPDNVTVIIADVPDGIWRAPEGSSVVLGAASRPAMTK